VCRCAASAPRTHQGWVGRCLREGRRLENMLVHMCFPSSSNLYLVSCHDCRKCKSSAAFLWHGSCKLLGGKTKDQTQEGRARRWQPI